MKTFHIDGSGISQVKSHAKFPKEDLKQLKFEIEKQTALSQKHSELTLEDLVVNAKILQAMHFAENNYTRPSLFQTEWCGNRSD